jgi:hypothetical protein
MSAANFDHGITEHEKIPSPSASNTSTATAGPLDASLLNEALFPPDSYSGETYWADLPRAERTKFAMSQSNAEAKAEAKWVWEMFKRDPMEPFRVYWNRYVLAGMGLFVEGMSRRLVQAQAES